MKVRQNRGAYIEILRRMTPEQRLRKAFELRDVARELFRRGLRSRHPDMAEDELAALERKLAERWHNRIY
jgi:hypothetical protein